MLLTFLAARLGGREGGLGALADGLGRAMRAELQAIRLQTLLNLKFALSHRNRRRLKPASPRQSKNSKANVSITTQSSYRKATTALAVQCIGANIAQCDIRCIGGRCD
jgi:hypothetical protein